MPGEEHAPRRQLIHIRTVYIRSVKMRCRDHPASDRQAGRAEPAHHRARRLAGGNHGRRPGVQIGGRIRVSQRAAQETFGARRGQCGGDDGGQVFSELRECASQGGATRAGGLIELLGIRPIRI
jgi:hypothetical protein